MCLSFIFKGTEDTLIGMNFDNCGMKYSLNTQQPDRIIMMVDGGRGKYPSFGITSDGVFVNNLVVDDNGLGRYKRPSTKVTHTTKLVSDLLNGLLNSEQLASYLERMEIVNTPDWSTHNMIVDVMENVWIVEPGRGNLKKAAGAYSHVVMSNFSLVDWEQGISIEACSRYERVVAGLARVEALGRGEALTVDDAFQILESARQTEGEWVTDFAMVYSKKDNTVYYRDFGHNQDQVAKYPFTATAKGE